MCSGPNPASHAEFDRLVMFMVEGGTIPVMRMQEESFPAAQSMRTGVLGPGSNTHGPNLFLPLKMAQNITGSIAHAMALHGQQVNG